MSAAAILQAITKDQADLARAQRALALLLQNEKADNWTVEGACSQIEGLRVTIRNKQRMLAQAA